MKLFYAAKEFLDVFGRTKVGRKDLAARCHQKGAGSIGLSNLPPDMKLCIGEQRKWHTEIHFPREDLIPVVLCGYTYHLNIIVQILVLLNKLVNLVEYGRLYSAMGTENTEDFENNKLGGNLR